MSQIDFMKFYYEQKNAIERKISNFNREIVKEENPLLAPFLNDLSDLNSGGKMLRGVFVNLGYRLAGGKDLQESNGLALAFEVFQTAVLIHDDIIDHADLRRGKKTVHKRYGERIHEREINAPTHDVPESAALCVGDLGLYMANKIIADEYCGNPKLGKLISYFNDIVLNTIRGELLDVILPCEIRNPELTKEEAAAMLEKSVMEIYRLKTAYYSVIGPIHLGMLLGEMNEDQMALIDEFAEKLGIAFQIKDDILGIYSTEANMGKTAVADIEEAKLTILYQYVKMNYNCAYDELMKHYGKSEVTKADVTAVRELFKTTGALRFAEDMMNKCFEEAKEILEKCDFVKPYEKELLIGVGQYFMNRTK